MEEKPSAKNLAESIRGHFEHLGGVNLPDIVRDPMREPPNFASTIILRPTNLHWLEGTEDRYELCAHSGVEFCIDGHALITESAGDWTVSASALYLLRTLSKPHNRSLHTGQQLFPCCGNGLFEGDGEDVVIVGCNAGIDFEVSRDGDDVVISSPEGKEYCVGGREWRDAVCRFSDLVQEFYASSARKEPGEDAPAFQSFMAEWRRRRSLA
jgi:hypothetical protein